MRLLLYNIRYGAGIGRKIHFPFPYIGYLKKTNGNFKKIKWPFPKRIELVIHQPIPYNEVIKMSSLELSNYVKEIIMKPLKQSKH